MTIIEKILARHSGSAAVRPGDIIDIEIDARVARDFGGAGVVKNLRDRGLEIADPSKTFFTFDCNPTGSDQKYAVNQHICRQFAREEGIRIFDIDRGIGTHILIDEGLVYPGATAVSTDSHANILGAIGAFGQGMGDMDIAAAWNKGKIWFQVPESVRILLEGQIPGNVSAKDIVLNLLQRFGANSLLGYSIDIGGEAAERLTLDQRITISSMATEMGAIIIFFRPSAQITEYCSIRSKVQFDPVFADPDAQYLQTFTIDISAFRPRVSMPGEPHNTSDIQDVAGQKIDSAFIGSCTNGRLEDLETAARILKDRKVAPGVVLKIVPATDRIWIECLEKGLIEIFKRSGALVSNAGCAGCAAGQVGQNGQGEVTISTGNRNFHGKQGRGSLFLASPEIVAASAVAGYITTPGMIPATPAEFRSGKKEGAGRSEKDRTGMPASRPAVIEGRVWLIRIDNIDTDMIYHNRYLAVTDKKEMGQYTFDNLTGHEDFASRAKPGDIVVAARNFGSGSSRQQAVDCFGSLGISAVIAESFGSIYQRNAINAAFPVVTCRNITDLHLEERDMIRIDFVKGEITNLRNGFTVNADPFPEVQYTIYQKGGLL